jgi:hypothetical protein
MIHDSPKQKTAEREQYGDPAKCAWERVQSFVRNAADHQQR